MGGSLVFGLYGGDGQVYKRTLQAPRSRHIIYGMQDDPVNMATC